jgi:outer membrane immunogenic protein
LKKTCTTIWRLMMSVALRASARILLTFALLILIWTARASAANLPLKAAAGANPNWNGFYLGASVGGRWNRQTWTTTGFPGPPFVPANTFDNPHDFTAGSGRLGGYAGYNWQFRRNWVAGLEADFAWADNSSSTDNIVGSGVAGMPATADSTEISDRWDGGIRARLGYLVRPDWLLFATAGPSWMSVKATVTCGNPSNWCSGANLASARTDSTTKTLTGWTIGGGLEAAVTSNLMLRVEYRYAQYADDHVYLLQGGAVGGTNVDAVDANIDKVRTQTVLFGLAYKFGP